MLASFLFSVPAPLALAADITAPFVRFHEPQIAPLIKGERNTEIKMGDFNLGDINGLFAELQKNNPEKAKEIYEELMNQNTLQIV